MMITPRIDWSRLFVCLLLSAPALLGIAPAAPCQEDSDTTIRSYLYREFVVSGFLAAQGVVGVPPWDAGRDYVEVTHRPPGNYVGLDYIALITPAEQTRFPLTGINLHPRLVLDRMEPRHGLHRVKFAPQDFWFRFNPGRIDRFTVRLGQFVLPYGVNPILAPRQRFILPLEATDLGLKWDWGVGVKGPYQKLDWEVAATIGSGEALHSPRLFQGSDSTSYLITGRLGSPTYVDSQYGISFLIGDLPMVRAAHRFNDLAISRWRLGLDAFRKNGTYLMYGGQITVGQDGWRDDKRFMMVPMGETADVLGLRAMVDYVLPRNQDVRLAAQAETVIRDLGTSGTDDTALILELNYSVTTSLTLLLDGRWEINSSMGEENSALYCTFIYYTR